MRILFSAIGSRGDIQPLVALALHMKGLGHQVHACVPPDFSEWIEGLNIPVTSVGPRVRTFAEARPMARQSPTPLTATQRRQMADGTVATQFQTLADAARGCDIIVAASALQVAARSVAEHLGIDYVFVAYSPVVLPSMHHAPPPLPPAPGEQPADLTDNRSRWALDAKRFNDLFGASVNAHRATLGLAPVADLQRHMMTDRPWLAADPALAPWPEPAGDHSVFQTGAWIYPDHRTLAKELQHFLDSGDTPVYFGFGSTRASEDAGHVIRQVARSAGRRAIVSGGWFDTDLVENDDNCLSIGDANLHALFARVAAVVHHGGAGTTTAAALAGVPQVVIPTQYDQHYWAQRVQTLGIGTAHLPGAPTVESLADALDRTLASDVAARARSTAALVRRDGTQIAAEALTASRRAGAPR